MLASETVTKEAAEPPAEPVLSSLPAPSLLRPARRTCHTTRRKFNLALLCLCALGLVLRLIHVFVFYGTPVEDMVTYMAYGEHYFRQPFPPETIYLTTRNPPGYPIFVGFFRWLFGWDNIRPILYAQAFIDTLTIASIGAAGRMLFGARAGLCAALLYASSHTAVTYTGQLMTEILGMAPLAASVWAMLWLLEKPGVGRAVLCGVLCGLAVYVRLNVLLVGGVLAATVGLQGLKMVWSGRPRAWCMTLLYPSVISVAMVLTILPWSVRNSRILEQPVLMSSSNSIRFLLGANPATRGEYSGEADWPVEWMTRIGSGATDRTLAYSRARDVAAQGVVQEFLNTTHRAFYFQSVVPNKYEKMFWDPIWNFTGQGVGAAIDHPAGPFVRYPFVYAIVIAILGFLGLFARTRGGRPRWFAGLLWGSLFLPVAYLAIDPRYRYLSELPLVLGAGAVVARTVFSQAMTRRFPLVIGIFVAACFAWSAAATYQLSGPNLAAAAPADRYPKLASAATNDGLTLMSEGKPEGTRVPLGEIPVNVNRAAHLLLDFHAHTFPPEKSEFLAWDENWPSLSLTVLFLDANRTPFASVSMPHGGVGQFHNRGGWFWQLIELPGLARSMQLVANVGTTGTVQLSRLNVSGPLGYDMTVASQELTTVTVPAK